MKPLKLYLYVYIGNGCICVRTLCDSRSVDNTTVDIDDHLNTCICNFTKTAGCNLNNIFSSYHNSSITIIQLCIISRSITYHYWDEPHIGEKTVATWWPTSIVETNSEQWAKNFGYHSSWYREDTPCPQKGEEKWGKSLMGYLIRMVSNSNQNTEPDVTVLLTLVRLCLLWNIFLYIRVWKITR